MTIVSPAIAHGRDMACRESLGNEIVFDRLGAAFAEFDCRVFVIHFCFVGIATNRKFSPAPRLQVGVLSVENALGILAQLRRSGGEKNPIECAFCLMVIEINNGVHANRLAKRAEKAFDDFFKERMKRELGR